MKNELSDMGKLLMSQARAMNHNFESGMSVGAVSERNRLLPLFQAIFNAYRRALADPNANLPTPLHLALANAQRVVGELRSFEDARKFIGDADPGDLVERVREAEGA